MCNKCPNCKSENLQKVNSIFIGLVHNDTEVYVRRHCPDCGCSFTAVYQFDRHDIKD